MIQAILGGALIGLAVSLMLLFNGKVTGISGILGGALQFRRGDLSWRLFFILGLFSGGLVLQFFNPDALTSTSHALPIDYILAGALVGFGTLLGNGCTSGHGVCGISRLSVRSILATLVFMLTGILSLWVFKNLRGGL